MAAAPDTHPLPSPDLARLAIDDHSPDIFTIVCCNDSFQLAFDHATIKALLQVCRRAQCLDLRGWTFSGSPTSCKLVELCKLGSSRDWLCKHLTAVCMHHEFGTRWNEKKAVEMLEQFANDGHSVSQLWLGRCYYSGRDVFRDYAKAFWWFSESADQGNSHGQCMVDFCYSKGDGVGQDVEKAFHWFRQSAMQGNPFGEKDLGDCRRFGLGVIRDIDTAMFWYRKSAEQGLGLVISCIKELGKWP